MIFIKEYPVDCERLVASWWVRSLLEITLQNSTPNHLLHLTQQANIVLCVKLWAEKKVKLGRPMSKGLWSLSVVASLFGGIVTGVVYHFLLTIRKNRRQI